MELTTKTESASPRGRLQMHRPGRSGELAERSVARVVTAEGWRNPNVSLVRNGIAALAYPEPHITIAAAMLTRHQPQPRREFATALEFVRIARRGRQRAHAFDLDKALTALVVRTILAQAEAASTRKVKAGSTRATL